MMKKMLFFAVCFAVLWMPGCALQSDNADERVIEETAFYKISEQNHLYTAIIYDRHHGTARMETPTPKPPKLSIEDGNLVKLTYQAGTGISTQWGYFYDVENDRFSDTFHSIYDVSDGKLITRDKEKLIVRNIFDEYYYCEITSFEKSLSKAAEPFTDVRFTETGLQVTYFTGESYAETVEIVELPED